MPSKPRVLLYDLENAPAKGYFWPPGYDTNIIHVEEEWYMLSFAYKWWGEDEIHFERIENTRGNDGPLSKKLHRLYDEADAVMAHNGDRFDEKKAWTRMAYHGLGPTSPYVSVDTLKLLRSKFALTSNRLDAACRFFGIGEKLPTEGMHTWLGCMAGDEESWKVMEKYNRHDVVLLDGLYDKIAPYVRTKLNRTVWSGAYTCPSCGSDNLQSRGYRPSKRGGSDREYRNWQCNDCGHWSYELLSNVGRMRSAQ